MLYDKDIREPLFDFLEERYGKVRIIGEKRVGRSRAEFMMIRPGLSYIQKLNDLPAYKGKSKVFVADKILLRVPEEKVSYQISEELFERDYTVIEETIRQYQRLNRTGRR